MRELRCSNKKCKPLKGGKFATPQLLGKSMMLPGSVLEIKCPSCGTVTEFKSYEQGETTEQN